VHNRGWGYRLPKSLWDWIAYTGIWIGAVFEAIWFYSDTVPAVSLHVAPFFTDPHWALLPLVLLAASGVIMIVRALGCRPEPKPITVMPAVACAATTTSLPRIVAVPEVIADPETVPASFAEKYIELILETHTELQKSAFLRPHDGKWISLEGEVFAVEHSGDSVRVQLYAIGGRLILSILCRTLN
jgi:hypothetical protein